MLELAIEESDEETVAAVSADLADMQGMVEQLEFQRMFSGEMDASPCFLDIQAGSGGTEAQDWAEMLLRMYLRWAERRGWSSDLVEVLSLIHISEPTRPTRASRMPSSA